MAKAFLPEDQVALNRYFCKRIKAIVKSDRNLVLSNNAIRKLDELNIRPEPGFEDEIDSNPGVFLFHVLNLNKIYERLQKESHFLYECDLEAKTRIDK